MHDCWEVLPSGQLVPLRRTQELLADTVPILEDLLAVCVELTCVRQEADATKRTAHELVVRSRRQRLGLRLLNRTDLPSGP